MAIQHKFSYPNPYLLQRNSRQNKEFEKLLQIGSEKYARVMAYESSIESKRLRHGLVGNESIPKKTTTVAAMRAKSEGSIKQDGNWLGGMDLFITANEFFEWRNSKQLSMLHANYIDIDTPTHGNVSAGDSRKILLNSLSQLEARNIPAPNAIVSSGSGGWHLYWIYEPIEAFYKNQILWRAVARKILSTIRTNKTLKVDSSASSDPTRLLRLPGSFHTKAQNECECMYVGHIKYDFFELANSMGIEPAPLSKKKKKAKHTPKSHNIKDYWGKIYFKLIELANAGQVSQSHRNRDNFLFLAMVALQHIHGNSETALTAVKELNERFGLYCGTGIDTDPNNIDRYLSTCMNVRYQFKKETIIKRFADHFNCDISNLFAAPRRKLTKEECKKRQSQSARDTHAKQKKLTEQSIKAALINIHKSGRRPSYDKVATITGKSKRTIINHRKFYKNTVGALWSVSI